MTTIYLIRHAEAEGNIFRRLHGQYDSLLTPRGLRQVAQVEKRFANIHIDGCFASDLTRTCLTSRSVYLPKRLPLHRDARFREVNVGRWEDTPYAYLDCFEEESMIQFNHNPPVWHVEGAERFEEYTQRFIEAMTEAAEQFDGGTIAIFSHGAVMRSSLMRLFFMDDISKLNYSDNTGVSKLIYDKGQFHYEYLNDNTHLPEELSTYYIQRWWRGKDLRKESAVYFLPVDGDKRTLDVMLKDQAVGRVLLGEAENGVGHILGMTLKDGFDGRYYGDQMLGSAFSHFRKQGCTALYAAPGAYPDDIISRYEFDPETRTRNISTAVFDWGLPDETN